MNLKEVFERAKKGDVSILKLNPEILSSSYGKDLETPLHELAMLGKTQILNIPKKYLFKKDISERTPLHYLAMSKESDSVMLKFPKESFDMQDEDGKTPLHYLAERNNVMGIASAEQLAITDYENWNTPVMDMAYNDIKFDASVLSDNILKMKNSLGETVAHFLAYNGDKQVEDLKKYLDIKNLSGATPRELYEQASGKKITAKFHSWMRMRIRIVPEKMIDLYGNKFYYTDNGGKRIYTFTYPNKNILSFTLYRKNNDSKIGITYNEINKGNVFAKISGQPSSIKKMLIDWLSDNKVTIDEK